MLFPLPPPPPPPQPPPPPPLQPPLLPLYSTNNSDDSSYSYNPSILIISAIIAFAVVAIASIHLLLRSLSRSRSPSRSRHPSLIHHLSSSSSSSSSSTSPPSEQDRDYKSVIDSLPLFTLSKSLSTDTSLDCAVCLSPFQLSDELRLLPACRHAFHSHCIDTWLNSNLTCPLCRSSIYPIPPQQPPPAAAPEAAAGSESFRIEIGSVSRRTQHHDDSSSQQQQQQQQQHVRSRSRSSYSLGSSFEYVVEEDIEAVIARIRRRPDKEVEPPPGAAEVAEMVGGGGGGGGGSSSSLRGSWLKEYVDRLASSASSSFSSLRFSQRGSQRFDPTATTSASAAFAGDLEEDDGGFGTFYRWLVGV